MNIGRAGMKDKRRPQKERLNKVNAMQYYSYFF